MSRRANIAAFTVLVAAAAPSTAQSPRELEQSFVGAIKDYQIFVVPRCSPELVAAYLRINRPRDVAFVRSLRGTPLLAIYRGAVSDRAKQEEGLVVHCDGWGELPREDERSATIRDRLIAKEQRRLASIAAALPKTIEEGDVAFARMAAARDALLARKEP